MIRVDIFKNGNNITKLEMSGHAEYSDGDDIVCASASSVAFACLNGIEKVLGVKFGYETEDGYLFFVLPNDLDVKTQDKVNILTETFALYIKELEAQYPAHITVTELEV